MSSLSRNRRHAGFLVHDIKILGRQSINVDPYDSLTRLLVNVKAAAIDLADGLAEARIVVCPWCCVLGQGLSRPRGDSDNRKKELVETVDNS